MRKINTERIIKTVAQLCIEANINLPGDIERALGSACGDEKGELSVSVLETLCKNCRAAREEGIPICQDTGMAVVFIRLGQDVCIEGGLLEDAVNEGVRLGYESGYLRKSVVADPLYRVNTKDNTPAVLHLKLVRGDKIEITVAPKGFGSENMSALKMFTPSATKEDIIGFVVDSVVKAGGNPCPPVIVGVGLGGSFEKAALLAKEALLRPLDDENADKRYAEIEKELLERINNTGIGPAGFGGRTTALAVKINTYPTHIAGLPAAVNIGCHATRHASAFI